MANQLAMQFIQAIHKSKALASKYQHGIYMVGSDMTPSLPLEHSLSGVVYSGSSASSWSKLSVTPAFLAPIKSPTKSRVFSKPSRRAQLSPSKPRSSFPLSPSARVPQIPPAPPALGSSPTTCHPSGAVGHRTGNPTHAVVLLAGPPRHHRRPENHADARNRETPQNSFSSSLLIFLAFFLIF
jgi:hypothetical protein